MKARILYLVLPLLGALGLGLLYAAQGPSISHAVLTGVSVSAFAAAALGSVLAATAFGKGDYLRGAWALMALCYGLLLLDTAIFGAANGAVQRETSTFEAVTSGSLTLIANVATVAALAWVARAWRVAGLDLQVSRGAFIGAVVAAVVVSLALVSRGLLNDVTELLGGKLDALQGVASSLGDVAATALLVPMLLTALSLRGGSLAWPWGLLTASTVLWLGVDAVDLISSATGAQASSMLPLEEACRFGACLLQLTAGLAQRDAVTSA